jgi:hypothetical protein
MMVMQCPQAPGDAIAEFDVVMEVDTEGLTEEAYKVGEFAGNVTLLVEAQARKLLARFPGGCVLLLCKLTCMRMARMQEEGFMHSILVEEGRTVPVGTPVALMAELEESLSQLDGYKVPVGNIYEGGQAAVRSLSWQSYLKSDEGGGSRGCD